MATRHVVLTSLGGESMGDRHALRQQSLAELKEELGLEAYRRLILGGKILPDDTFVGDLELVAQDVELEGTVVLQVVTPTPCLSADAIPQCMVQEDRLGAQAQTSANVFLDRAFSHGSHIISFKVVEDGEHGFAIGIMDECGRKALADSTQPGSGENTWGWTAYDGRHSEIARSGGWHDSSARWCEAGSEVAVLLNCDSGSVSTSIGANSLQEAFVHAEWAAVPLHVCWHLKRGSHVDSISACAA